MSADKTENIHTGTSAMTTSDKLRASGQTIEAAIRAASAAIVGRNAPAGRRGTVAK